MAALRRPSNDSSFGVGAFLGDGLDGIDALRDLVAASAVGDIACDKEPKNRSL